MANEASFRLRDNFTQQSLDEACASEAQEHEVELVSCTFDTPTDEVRVTVLKHARSFLLDKFDATKDFYEVEASAEAKRR